jgi:hypothetical protein
MKDYYRILGVKEDATHEEIRQRYVELVKRHHPDLRQSEKENSIIKEINQAYGVLKDEAARMDYDLQQSLWKAYLKRSGKRERPRLIRRAAFPLCIFSLSFLLFLSGLILWKKIGAPVRPMSVAYHPILPSPPREPEPKVLTRESTPRVVSPSRQKVPRPIEIDSMGTGANAGQAAPSEKPLKQTGQSSPPVVRISPDPILAGKSTPPPPLLSEEEVRQFLDRYLDRYVHKDIHGFLSLFSQKAIQNGKDGLDTIRAVYLNFFDQSERLIYRLEDIRIVIDGADAEVTGYYHVTQNLKKEQNEKLWKGHLRWVLAKEEKGLKIVSIDYRPQTD